MWLMIVTNLILANSDVGFCFFWHVLTSTTTKNGAGGVHVHRTRRAPHDTDPWSLPVRNQALRRLRRVSAESSAVSATESKLILRGYAWCLVEMLAATQKK